MTDTYNYCKHCGLRVEWVHTNVTNVNELGYWQHITGNVHCRSTSAEPVTRVEREPFTPTIE